MYLPNMATTKDGIYAQWWADAGYKVQKRGPIYEIFTSQQRYKPMRGLGPCPQERIEMDEEGKNLKEMKAQARNFI